MFSRAFRCRRSRRFCAFDFACACGSWPSRAAFAGCVCAFAGDAFGSKRCFGICGCAGACCCWCWWYAIVVVVCVILCACACTPGIMLICGCCCWSGSGAAGIGAGASGAIGRRWENCCCICWGGPDGMSHGSLACCACAMQRSTRSKRAERKRIKCTTRDCVKHQIKSRQHERPVYKQPSIHQQRTTLSGCCTTPCSNGRCGGYRTNPLPTPLTCVSMVFWSYTACAGSVITLAPDALGHFVSTIHFDPSFSPALLCLQPSNRPARSLRPSASGRF